MSVKITNKIKMSTGISEDTEISKEFLANWIGIRENTEISEISEISKMSEELLREWNGHQRTHSEFKKRTSQIRQSKRDET